MSTWDEAKHPRSKNGEFGNADWAKKVSDKLGKGVGETKAAPEAPKKVRIKHAGVRSTRSLNAGVVSSLIGRSTKADKAKVHGAILAQSHKPVNVRVSETALSSILKDKRIKTIHEKHVSAKGKDYLQTRIAYEDEVMGLGGVPAKKRPVYGYVGNVNDVTSYGAYAITLKDSVKKRTTVSAGDSLNGMLDTHPINSLHALDFKQLKGMIGKDNALPLAMRGELNSSSYLEAQVHGGVRIGDIQSITVPADAPSSLVKQIEAAGIAVHHES